MSTSCIPRLASLLWNGIFGPMPRSSCSEREAKNDEPGSQPERASQMYAADVGAIQSVLLTDGRER